MRSISHGLISAVIPLSQEISARAILAQFPKVGPCFSQSRDRTNVHTTRLCSRTKTGSHAAKEAACRLCACGLSRRFTATVGDKIFINLDGFSLSRKTMFKRFSRTVPRGGLFDLYFFYPKARSNRTRSQRVDKLNSSMGKPHPGIFAQALFDDFLRTQSFSNSLFNSWSKLLGERYLNENLSRRG